MATRIKEWMIPYTWWDGIEITDNHVINVLLRAANNLIHVNEDRELYVDLQLPAGIAPDDEFPVGVTTGEILAEDWWQQSGTIINSKTTSGDYVRLIYANDWNLYYDPWTWVWIMIGTATAIDVNTKTFFPSGPNDLTTAQAIIDYYKSGKNPLIMLWWTDVYSHPTAWSCLSLCRRFESETPDHPMGVVIYEFGEPADLDWKSTLVQIITNFSDEVLSMPYVTYVLWNDYVTTYNKNQTVNWTKTFTTSPVVPSKNTAAWNNATTIATEAQVYLKQDKLTAGSNITIDASTNTISANVQWALVYKWNVTDVTDLPSSWNTVWDVYYVENDWLMYAWDWTAWKAVGNTQIDLSNYFDMTVNTTDNITQGSTNLFVTQAMIDAWNWKQWALTAGTNIQINNWVISATDTTYSAGTGIWITWTTINNTAPFSPENAGSVGQVLKRTSTGVRWSNEFFENVFVTQAEYDALPSSKNADGKTYFIYS